MSQVSDPITAEDFIHSQSQLEKDALEAMPYDPTECTYFRGSLRQPLFACLTCSTANSNPVGVCYSCSIQCHSTHDIVELFTKRDFQCDCGTSRCALSSQGPCSIRLSTSENIRADDVPSASNTYNHNFSGLFCLCNDKYDPQHETRDMIQCYFGYSCGEDWFHEDCILGIPSLRETGALADLEDGKCQEAEGEDTEKDMENICDRKSRHLVKQESDAGSEIASQSPPLVVNDTSSHTRLPSLESFDAFICWDCVSSFNEEFNQLSSHHGIVYSTVPHIRGCKSQHEYDKLTQTSRSDQSNDSAAAATEGSPKRKRVKLEISPAPYPHSILLSHGFRDAIKSLRETMHVESPLRSFLDNHQYLYMDDPVYEPPQETDSLAASMFDMGANALHNMPREKAIEGLEAYDKIRSRLSEFLLPFAQNGKVVTETEVRSFFSKIMDTEKTA